MKADQKSKKVRTKIIACLLAVLLAIAFSTIGEAGGPSTESAECRLPSWNDGAAKKSITEFVATVAKVGGPDYVPPARRIAVFDNDGTLWAEQPMYFQFFFMLDRIKALAPQHPEWKTEEPFASILKGDMKSAVAGGEKSLGQMMMATHAGMTSEEFEKIVSGWIATARHPKTGRLFTEMVYQPMLEVISCLRINRFKTYIVSGGGVEFMRPWSERVYGIPPEQVIGSSVKMKFELREGRPVLVRLPDINFGNSDGDLQMLQWTAAGRGMRLAVVIHHTDADREWAYDRNSPIGRLDKVLDDAMAKDWTVVEMKKDWKTIFVFEKKQ
jgi:hypothetical protein